jgi:hypothetical protein
METIMATEHRKPWKTPDFELKFREAMGRNMTHQEREFFGLDDEDSRENDKSETTSSSNGSSDSAKFSWQALRRISLLMG